MIFLIDGSRENTVQDLDAQRNLITNTVHGYLRSGKTKTKVALGIYGKIYEWGTFTQLSNFEDGLIDLLDRSNRVGGKRKMGKALDFAMNRYNATTSNKKQIYVMLTTGLTPVVSMTYICFLFEPIQRNDFKQKTNICHADNGRQSCS